MSIKMSNREMIDGGWSFVDLDNQPIEDHSLIEGWEAMFETDRPDVVEIVPYQANADDRFNRSFRSLKNGAASIRTTITGPNGEHFEMGETITVISSAPNRPAFTFGTPRPEEEVIEAPPVDELPPDEPHADEPPPQG